MPRERRRFDRLRVGTTLISILCAVVVLTGGGTVFDVSNRTEDVSDRTDDVAQLAVENAQRIRDIAVLTRENARLTRENLQSVRALCALRADLRRRIAGSTKFLDEHPNGAADISRQDIQDSINNQKRTIRALRRLSCPKP